MALGRVKTGCRKTIRAKRYKFATNFRKSTNSFLAHAYAHFEGEAHINGAQLGSHIIGAFKWCIFDVMH
jgi:hypothetical protein